jgi:hypothetical protein
MTRPADTPDWDATGNTSTPSASRKTSGWLGATGTTPGDKPPAQEFNWFWNLVSGWLSHLNSTRSYTFDSLEDALAIQADLQPALPAGEVAVINSYDPTVAPWTLNDSGRHLSGGATNNSSVDCDGDIVVVGGGDYIFAFARGDIGGTNQIWFQDAGTPVNDVAVVGGQVYVANVTQLEARNRTTGAIQFTIVMGGGDPVTLVESDGVNVACVEDEGANRIVRLFTATNLSTVGGFSPFTRNAATNALAMDGERIYVGGVRSAGDYVTALDYTGATVWAIDGSINNGPLDDTGGSNPTVHDLATDGELLVIRHDNDDQNVNVTVVSCADPNAIVAMAWTASTFVADGFVGIDDRYVYVTDEFSGSSWVLILDKRTGTYIRKVEWSGDPSDPALGIASDGDLVFVAGQPDGFNPTLKNYRRPEPPRVWRKQASDDRYRRLQTLITPEMK